MRYLAIVLLLFSCAKIERKAIIVEKHYKPSSHGLGISTSGNVVMTGDSESFSFIIRRIDNKEYNTKEVLKDDYFKYNINDTLTYYDIVVK